MVTVAITPIDTPFNDLEQVLYSPKKQFSINSLRAERLNESFEEEAI